MYRYSKYIFLISTLLLLKASVLLGQETSVQNWFDSREDRIDWHREARFGAMVHFTPDGIGKMNYYDGKDLSDPYRGRPIPSSEFDRYYTKMTLQNFDANAWVKAFADAGMKYFVFVAKHHNGFCMWNSKYTNYDIFAVTGRDVVKELSEACEKYDITFCLYYSIMDWYHPHATGDSHGGKGYELPPGIEPDLENYIAYMNAQLEELTTNYGPIGLLWYDGAWMSRWTENPKLQWTKKHAQDLYDYTLKLQEEMICNNRMQRQHYKMTDNLGDYYTPELFIGNFDRENHWESVMKLGESWHWVPSEPVKSLAEIQQMLCRCAGSDGNLLLNLGPHPDGYLMSKQVERIKELGDWLKVNGEAIYETRGGPYLPSKSMVSTCKGNHIFLHIFDWIKTAKELIITKPGAKIISCQTGNERLNFRINKDKIYINVPVEKREQGVTIIKLVIDKDAFNIPVIETEYKVDHGVDTKQEVDFENL